MAGITLKAEIYKLDKSIFQEVVLGFIRQEMIKAIKEYLRTSLVKIPKRTGFLRGSFTDIVSRFGVTGTGAGSSGYGYRNEYYGKSRILKTPTSGVQFATKPEQVLRRSGNGYVFELDSDISYYKVNDFGSRIPGAPWESIQAGLAAMISYLESSANRFPDINNLLTKITIRADGSGMTTTSNPPNAKSIIATRELRIQGFD